MSATDFYNVWRTSKTTANNRLILMAIGSYADENGVSWPSLQTIQERANIPHRRTVSRCIQNVVENHPDELAYIPGGAYKYAKAYKGAASNLYFMLLNRSPSYIEAIQEFTKNANNDQDLPRDTLTLVLKQGRDILTDTRGNLSPESMFNNVNKEDDEESPIPYKVWEDATGLPCTQLIAQEISASINEWEENKHKNTKNREISGRHAVSEAIRVMGKNGVKSTTYVDRILFSGDHPWIINGFGAKLPKPSSRSRNGKQPQPEWNEAEMEDKRQRARERIKVAKEK